jgi:U3 small nucleolar RNA-associated protein 18
MTKEEFKKEKKSKATPSPLVGAASLHRSDAEKAHFENVDSAGKPRPSQFKKSKKRARQEAEEEAEERRLTALLFGTAQLDNENHEDEQKQKFPISFEIDRDGDDEKDESSLFEIDREGGDSTLEKKHGQTSPMRALVSNLADDPESDQEDDTDGNPTKRSGLSAAWVDEDDVALSVNLLATDRLRKLRTSKDEAEAEALDGAEFEKRLRKRFQETAQTTARTDWAVVPNDSRTEVEQDEDRASWLLASTSMRLLDSSLQKLPPNVLSIVRCRDANQSDPNQAVVQAVHFHPGSDPDRPLLLTAGLDKTLRFFQVGSEESEKIHGIHCK